MLDCLVIGGVSPIGSALRGVLASQGLSVGWTARRVETGACFLDLDTLEGLETLPCAKTTVLVAANTKFAACEIDPLGSRRVNVDGPVAVARHMASGKSRIVFFSSIAVHDGSLPAPDETVLPRPTSVYGKQKLAAELALAQIAPGLAIIRPSKVVTPDFPLFRRWIDDLRSGRSIGAFNDLFVSPITLDALVFLSAKLITTPQLTGVFQLSAQDQVTYHQIAIWIAEAVGVSTHLVESASAVGYTDATAIHAPRFSTLGCRRAAEACGIERPPSRAVVDYVLSVQGSYN